MVTGDCGICGADSQEAQSLLCYIASVRFWVSEWVTGPSGRWHVQYRDIPRYKGFACRNPLETRHAYTPPWDQPNVQLLISMICHSVHQLIEREAEFIGILSKAENLSSNATESHHRRLASYKKTSVITSYLALHSADVCKIGWNKRRKWRQRRVQRSGGNKATRALGQAVTEFGSNQTNALGSSRHKSAIIPTGNDTP
jgi:hypothetical protein